MVPTVEDLRRLLRFLGAEHDDESGGWAAPCPVCGDADARGDNMKVNPGDRRLCVCHCFHCVGDRSRARGWWREVILQLGPDAAMSAVIAAGVTRDESRRLWAELERRPAPDPAAPVDVRDRVYRAVLDRLGLSDAHRRWLSSRGADPDRASAAGYRSTPAAADGIAADLRREYGDAVFAVPGFARDGGAARLLTRPDAVLIPSRDTAGRVQALKHRMLDGGGARMRWLSSSRSGGPAAANFAHCPLGVGGRRWPRVWLTEGERKADAHWWRTGLPTAAAAGVGAWLAALPVLAEVTEEGGEVVVAMDRDDAGRRAEGPVAAGVAAAGHRVLLADWDGPKGLDDAVAAGREVRTRPYRRV